MAPPIVAPTCNASEKIGMNKKINNTKNKQKTCFLLDAAG